ncbi:MAG: lysoplasmalogenase [Pseudomonadota bacterium]
MIRFMVAVVIGAIYVALVPHEPCPLHYFVKAAPMVLLASIAASARLPLLVVAFLASAAGDALLAIDRAGLLLPALGAFLITQLCYVRHFWQHRAPTRTRVVAAVAVGAVAVFYLAGIVAPRLDGGLLVAVPIYGVVLATMAGCAIVADCPRQVAVGAALFVLADSLIAWNQFVAAFGHSTMIIVSIYLSAQLLIAHGLLPLRGNREVPA